MKMTRDEYEAIKARVACGASATVGASRIALFCVDVFGNMINPEDIGEEAAAEFKARADAFASATRDRAALVRFIEDGFDIEWFEEARSLAQLTQELDDEGGLER